MKIHPSDLRERLRYVRVDRDDLDLSVFPDFMILGPQRTGTTWLCESLRYHPQVVLSRPKELYYFDHLHFDSSELSFLHPEWSSNLSWYLERMRMKPSERRRRESECRAWYGKPFEPRLHGEATASYAAGVPEKVIGDITALNPDLKGILLVRHPVDRAWSMAKYVFGVERGLDIRTVPAAEVREYLESRWVRRNSLYTQQIAKWRRALGADHLLVERSDRLTADPRGLLADVLAFLDVDRDPAVIDRMMTCDMINASATARMPAEFRQLLEELFAEEVRKLQELELLD